MTLEDKLKEISDLYIPTSSKVSKMIGLLLEDLIAYLSKGVSENDRLSEDCDREPQAVQDYDET